MDGFVGRTQVFVGNVAWPATLTRMPALLKVPKGSPMIMDGSVAMEDRCGLVAARRLQPLGDGSRAATPGGEGVMARRRAGYCGSCPSTAIRLVWAATR